MAGINKEGIVFTKVNEESFITDIDDESKVLLYVNNEEKLKMLTKDGDPLPIGDVTVGLVSGGEGDYQEFQSYHDITKILFDTDSGFDIEPLDDGEILVKMNSTFKTWLVDGQPSLIAEGLDTIEFVAGDGITIETDNTEGSKWIKFEVSEDFKESIQTQIDDISGSLGTLYQGKITCNTEDMVYTVVHSEINVNETFPQISLSVPTSGAALYIQGITNRTPTSFDVVLSSEPETNDYDIYWSILDSSTVVSGTDFDGITVSSMSGSNEIYNEIGNVKTMRFDADGGFEVIDLNNGEVKITTNSTFKTWQVEGQDDLVAEGLDTIEFIGDGIEISTDNTSGDKKITFKSNRDYVLLDNELIQAVSLTEAEAAAEGWVWVSTAAYGGGVAITGRGAITGDVRIPDFIGSLPVVSITSDGLWQNDASITSITALSLKAIIASNTFFNAPNLSRVNLPSLEEISGNNVFQSCGVTHLRLPSLESVTSGILVLAVGATLIEVDLPNFITDGGVEQLFGGCQNLETVRAPKLQTLGDRAFNIFPGSIRDLDLPSLVSLGAQAFDSLESLERIHLPLVDTIGNEAFIYCSGLQALHLGSLPSSVGTNIFTGTNPDAVVYYEPGDMGYAAFWPDATATVISSIARPSVPSLSRWTESHGVVPEDGVIIRGGNSYTWEDDYITSVEVATISSGLQTQINNISGGSGTLITADSIELSTLELSGGIPTSLVPDTSGVYDLGSADKPWRELYLEGNTIYLGGKPLGISNNRLVFETSKTLAFTDDIHDVSDRIDEVSEESNTVIRTVTQPTHGFSLLQPIRTTTAGGSYSLNEVMAPNWEPLSFYDRQFTVPEGEWWIQPPGPKTAPEATQLYYQGSGEYKIEAWSGKPHRMKMNNGNTNNPQALKYFYKEKVLTSEEQEISIKISDWSPIVRTLPTNGRDSIGSYRGVGIILYRPEDDFRSIVFFSPLRDTVNRFSVRTQSTHNPYQGGTDGTSNSANSFLLTVDKQQQHTVRLRMTITGETQKQVRCWYNLNDGGWIDIGLADVRTSDTNLKFMTGDTVRVGFFATGGMHRENSWTWAHEGINDIAAKISEISGNLTLGGAPEVWTLAGAGPTREQFAEAIVSEVVDPNTFRAVFSGMITSPNQFEFGKIAYLSQTELGGISYTKPNRNSQVLWSGISDNEGLLGIADSGPTQKITIDGKSFLIPEDDNTDLGSEEVPWVNGRFSEEVYIAGTPILESIQTLTNDISGSVQNYSSDERELNEKWIDDSPIYRKVFVIEIQEANIEDEQVVLHNIDNIGELVNVKGFEKNMQAVQKVFNVINIKVDESSVRFSVDGTKTVTIILEYTKMSGGI